MSTSLHKILYFDLSSTVHSHYIRISTKISKSLYTSGYVNLYEVVTTPYKYFLKTTFLTSSQLNSLETYLSTYDLYIGMSHQDLSNILRQKSRNYYDCVVLPPIVSQIRAHSNFSDINLTHEFFAIYGKDECDSNLDPKSLALYYRYYQYL